MPDNNETNISKIPSAYHPTGFVAVTFASKLHHAAKLRKACQNHPEIYIASRWVITHDVADMAARPASHTWQDIVDDVIRSDVVIVYIETEDRIKAALTQVGVAWAYNKPVYVVGEHEDYDNWRFHRLCKRVPTLEQALMRAKQENVK